MTEPGCESSVSINSVTFVGFDDGEQSNAAIPSDRICEWIGRMLYEDYDRAIESDVFEAHAEAAAGDPDRGRD